jgi:hypothetical protein
MAENALLVTTETESSKRERAANVVFCWIVGLIAFSAAVFFGSAPDHWFSRTPDLWGRILSALFCGAIGGICPVALRSVVRGNWRLDDEGILFMPLRGTPKHLAWRDVDAIFAPSMRTQQVLLRAGKVKLPINLRWETRQRRDEVNGFLRNKLGESFDVFDRSPERISIRRLFWISAVTSAATLFYFGILILPSYYLQYEHWRYWVAVWMPLPFVSLYPWAIIVVWRERRKGWIRRKSPLLPTTD